MSTFENQRDSASAGSVDAAVSRIDHVAIAAYDAGEAARWYEQHLGLRRVHDEFVEAAGVRLLWLVPRDHEGEGSTIQIVEPQGPGPVAEFLKERGSGLHHVCFAVSDLTETLVSHRQDPGTAFTGGYGLPCAFLVDSPDGALIELVEAPSHGRRASP